MHASSYSELTGETLHYYDADSNGDTYVNIAAIIANRNSSRRNADSSLQKAILVPRPC